MVATIVVATTMVFGFSRSTGLVAAHEVKGKKTFTVASGIIEGRGSFRLLAKSSKENGVCTLLRRKKKHQGQVTRLASEGCDSGVPSERKLSAIITTDCNWNETMVFGLISRPVAHVDVYTANATRHAARRFRRPKRMRFDGAFFMASLADAPSIVEVRATNKRGKTLAVERYFPELPCEGSGLPELRRVQALAISTGR